MVDKSTQTDLTNTKQKTVTSQPIPRTMKSTQDPSRNFNHARSMGYNTLHQGVKEEEEDNPT